jgi:hypothetical protein
LHTVFATAFVATTHRTDLMMLVFALLACSAFGAHAEEAACDSKLAEQNTSSSSLLQAQKGRGDVLLRETSSSVRRTCSWKLVGNQDGTRKCDHLQGKDYISGDSATLDEAGYTETAKLCCHHEMSLFVRREITRQGFDVCDLSDLHGFVHWYDCTNDMPKSFKDMQAEIAGASTKNCPWLGNLPNCPVKDENCLRFSICPAEFTGMYEGLPGASAPLDETGYAGVAARCCHTEMEQFVRREIDQLGFKVCNEGSLQGFLHWFDCSHDNGQHHQSLQTFAKLEEGLRIARSGLPPMCPWLGGKDDICPPRGHNCPVVEEPEPMAHRRRTACR